MFFIIITLIFLTYLHYRRTYSYWSDRNVKHDFPLPIFGNNIKNTLRFNNANEQITAQYKKYSGEKVHGYYNMSRAALVISDLDLAHRILTTDFKYFHERRLNIDPEIIPFHRNLFSQEGDNWKLLRQRMSGAFTTAKLKAMFPLVVKCCKKLQVVATELVDKEISIYDLMARYTTEVIGTCGFGIETDTINDHHSSYMQLTEYICGDPFMDTIKIMLWEYLPFLKPFLRIGDPRVEEGMRQILTQVQKQRNFKPSDRNDFIDLLMKLQAEGKLIGESSEKFKPDGTPEIVEMEMDDDCLVAQMFGFFAAGFHTSATSMSTTLHQLAYKPDIQRRIQKQIDDAVAKQNGELNYDALSELSLLKMCLAEGMRISTPTGPLTRMCTKKYTIPGLDVTIDPGVVIYIPTQAIQLDPKYYPDDPHEFIPERHSPEKVKNRHKAAFLPFGDGPRTCIGVRLGEMQSVAGVAAILQKFMIEPSENTVRKPVHNPAKNVVLGYAGSLPLRLKLRNQ